MTHPVLAALVVPLIATAAIPLPLGQGAAQEAGDIDLVEVQSDRHDRLTVAVRIGESGPYRFLIDTGSERTVLARSLAERLALPPAGRATLVGVAGTMAVDMVEVDEVTLGRRSYYGISAPLLEGRHIGADGIVGLDGLQEQRVLLDFDKGIMAVDSATNLGGNRGFEIVVRARRRSGQLILTNAVVDGVKTDVVIDTGAQNSIGNRALQRQLTRRRTLEKTELTSVTGQQITADVAMARLVRIGGLEIHNTAMAFADAPPFARLGLRDKPALLLGMSQLRAFKRVAIDFDTRQVLFDLPSSTVEARFGRF